MKISKHKFLILFLISLLINFVYFHFGLNAFGLSWGNLYVINGDAITYVDSCERFINGQGFTFFKTNLDPDFPSNFTDTNQYDLGVFYAFRSPGFAFFYLPLRIFLSQHYALITFLFLQIFFTALAKVYLTKIASYFTNSKFGLYISFIVINIIPAYAYYNNLLITDALGSSFLVFGVYYFIKNFQTDLTSQYSKYFLFFSGLFLTIALMLRPFLVVFLFSCGFFIIYKYWANKKTILKYALVFSIPFLIINGTWAIRNYIKTNKIIILADTFSYQNHKHLAFFEMKKFSEKLNYSDLWWDNNSPVYWLVNKNDERIPQQIFKNNLNDLDFKKIQKIKDDFHMSLDTGFHIEKRKELEVNTKNELKQLTSSIDLSIGYYFKRMHGFLNQPNIRFFHTIQYPINVVLVFLNSFIFRLVVYSSIFITLLLFYKRNYLMLFSFIFPTLFLLLYFGLHHQSKEYRFFYTYYPFLVLVFSKFTIEKKLINRVLLGFIVVFSILESIQLVNQEIIW